MPIGTTDTALRISAYTSDCMHNPRPGCQLTAGAGVIRSGTSYDMPGGAVPLWRSPRKEGRQSGKGDGKRSKASGGLILTAKRTSMPDTEVRREGGAGGNRGRGPAAAFFLVHLPEWPI